MDVNFKQHLHVTAPLIEGELQQYCTFTKAYFDKLQPKSTLVQTNTYKVIGADGNSLGPIGMTTVMLEFPKKFQQQFIVCDHLL